jgi:ribose-phosphate pyrophosphokinase
MKPLLVPLQDTEQISGPMALALDAEIAEIDLRRFPDGETYLRFDTSPEGRDVILLAGLSHPDAKLLALIFAAQTARALGATSVGLVAPYLPYMRQDIMFRPGEAVTSVHFAKLVSSGVDWLATIDPHLHRWKALSDIYDIPSLAAHAAPALAKWITNEVDCPLLIGPDAESEQWVSEIAALAGVDHIVLAKTRRGDRDVDVSLPDLEKWRHHTPVIVDDTISTASTMIMVTRQIVQQGLPPPICCAVHGIFADGAYVSLLKAGAARIVTSNTISHQSNGIDVSGILAVAASSMLKNVRSSRS